MDTLSKLRNQWDNIHAGVSKFGVKRELGYAVLDDERFAIWSAAGREGVHHYGKGGLLVHTNEVIDLMFLAKARLSCKTSDHLIFLSALWHDYGKLWDYELDVAHYLPNKWQNADHKYKIHHIARSVMEFTCAARQYKLDEQSIDTIVHAILSHHGQKAWGSPVEPRSELAWLLHISDHMSARINDWSTINS